MKTAVQEANDIVNDVASKQQVEETEPEKKFDKRKLFILGIAGSLIVSEPIPLMMTALTLYGVKKLKEKIRRK